MGGVPLIPPAEGFKFSDRSFQSSKDLEGGSEWNYGESDGLGLVSPLKF